jgi:hypothetical protein
MLKHVLMGSVVLVLTALGARVYAGDCGTDCDTTLRQGRVFEAGDSVVIYGGADQKLVRTWVPLLLDEAKAYLNNSAARIVEGRILGGTTTYNALPYAVLSFGTAKQLDENGTYTSNNILIWESSGRSNTVGRMLADGSLVWRANYAGAAQNNLEWELCYPGQQTPVLEPDEGIKILIGPGIDDMPGDAYLGTPGAVAGGLGFFVGNSNFDAFSGDIPRGVNIWDYDGTTPSDSQNPPYTYLQSDAETFANDNGVSVDAGDGRQTQPALARVNDVYYVVFGINDTDRGGSVRPAMFCIDAFEDGDGFDNAVVILPPAGFRFVDHQATGGGSNVYENAHFDLNSSGQIVALTESITSDPNDPNDSPTFQALLYNPTFTGDRITGYSLPVIIADAGKLDAKPEDELAGPFYYDPNDPAEPIVWYNSISGVGINERGNVAFTATYDTGEPLDPNDPNGPTRWSNAAYFYDASTDALHQVLREDDILTGFGATTDLAVGRISREDSDAFMGVSLADDADVLTVNFREHEDPELGGSRGVAVIAVGHVGDVDFDGDVDLGDLNKLLSAYGAQFETPSYDPQADLDLDGDIDLADLNRLLANYGSQQ